jgi:hypothetical protein
VDCAATNPAIGANFTPLKVSRSQVIDFLLPHWVAPVGYGRTIQRTMGVRNSSAKNSAQVLTSVRRMARFHPSTTRQDNAMYAHYFKTKAGHFIIISEDMSPNGIQILCSSKKEARSIAKSHNAICWNF